MHLQILNWLICICYFITGGLYAGATAGGNIKASAGLAGGVGAEHSAGAGYAAAQAGHNYAASGMVGDNLSDIRKRRKEEKQRKKEAKRAHQKKIQISK